MRCRTSEIHRAVEELTTLDERDSPDAVRRRLVERFHRVTASDLTIYFSAHGAGGAPRYAQIETLGRGGETLRGRFHDRPILAGPALDITRPRRDETASFRHLDLGEIFRDSEVDQQFLAPLGLASCLRLLVYDGGGEFAGYVGVYRCRDTADYRPSDRRRLQPLVAPLQALLTSTHRRECDTRRDGDALFSSRGRLLHASEALLGWLTPARRDALAHHVRRLERGEHEHCSLHLGGAQLRLCRMLGRGATVYLAQIVAAQPFRLGPLARLTARQREVADYAAAGATAAEIARALEISTETAREHLANVYDRLGVASRVELCQALQGFTSRS